jgi:hypothetical protein
VVFRRLEMGDKSPRSNAKARKQKKDKKTTAAARVVTPAVKRENPR